MSVVQKQMASQATSAILGEDHEESVGERSAEQS